MKRIKLILTFAISLLLTIAWADGTSHNLPSIKSLATTFLYEHTDLEFEGDGDVHEIPITSIGWPSTLGNIQDGTRWKLRIQAAREDCSQSWGTEGSYLLSTRTDATKPINDTYNNWTLRLCQRPNGRFCYVINNGYNQCTDLPENGKNFNIIVERDVSHGLVIRMLVDGYYQEVSMTHTLTTITGLRYALPEGFNISMNIVPATKLTATASGNGKVRMAVENKPAAKITNETSTYALLGEHDKVTITAVPDEGYRFVGWKKGNTTVSTNAEYTYTQSSDLTTEVTLTAEFEEVPVVTYTPPTLDNTGIDAAKTNYQYLKSFSYKGTKFYGDIEQTSDDLNNLYHIVNTEATALEVNPGEDLKIEFTAPTEIWASGTNRHQMVLSAYCDLDFNKDFESSSDFRKVMLGRYDKYQFNEANTGTGHPIVIPIPEGTQEGYTRVRIRFDHASNTIYSSFGGTIFQNQDPLKDAIAGSSTAETNRHVYDIIIHIVPKVGKALNVTCDNKGTVSATVTPQGGTATTYTDFPVSVPENANVVLTATPDPLNTFTGWKNSNNETIPGVGATYEFTMGSADISLSAEFSGYSRPEAIDGGLEDAHTHYQYFTSLSQKRGKKVEKFYGNIAQLTTPEELESHYHIVNDIATALRVAPGENLVIEWTNPDKEPNNTDGYSSMNGQLMLSAFCDLDMNKGFADEADYKCKERGTPNSKAFGNLKGTITIPIPAGATEGYTRMRLRLDHATTAQYNSELGYVPADAPCDRHVYDIIVKIAPRTTSTLDVYYATTRGKITAVVTPPGGTAWEPITVFPIEDIPFHSSVELTAEVIRSDSEFEKWTDKSGKKLGTSETLTIDDIGTEDVVYNASFEGKMGEATVECKNNSNHKWTLQYKAIGTLATIVRLTLADENNCCEDGCDVTIPETVKVTEETTATVEQVSTTVIHGEHHIKKLTLPETLEEIKRTRSIKLTGHGTTLTAGDLPTGNSKITAASTHAGYATKWEVGPVIRGNEEWWFVGVFDFPEKFDVTGKTDAQLNNDKEKINLRNHGCALLTSRMWPSQDYDDWESRFQIWVDGDFKGLGGIRLVNSLATANVTGSFLYFKNDSEEKIKVFDKTNGEGNVIEDRIMRFEVHNYPKADGSGNTLVYNVKVYQKVQGSSGEEDDYTLGDLLEEGSITTEVDNFEDISWVSNFAPSEVKCKSLNFYRSETNMTTYRDNVEVENYEFSSSDVEDGINTINLKNTLEEKDEWVMAIHYIPQDVKGHDEIIISTGDTYNKNTIGTSGISDGFRIVQKSTGDGDVIYFQSSHGGTTTDQAFEQIKLKPGYPITIIVYHYADGTLAVSATDRLNNQIERLEDLHPDMSDIDKLQSACTYENNTFDVTVATMEHLLFANCPYLEEIIIPESNPNYKTIDGAVYDKSGETLVLWPEGKVWPSADNAAVKTVFKSTYAANESYIELPDHVKKIAPLAFLNVRDDKGIERLTVNVDHVTDIERLSYVNAAVTYETTPKHFLEMQEGKNNQISFRLRLEQETYNEDYLVRVMKNNEENGVMPLSAPRKVSLLAEGSSNSSTTTEDNTPKTYSEISISNRFSAAYTSWEDAGDDEDAKKAVLDTWYSFVAPFDIFDADVTANFSEVRKLVAADVWHNPDPNNYKNELRVKFATLQHLADVALEEKNAGREYSENELAKTMEAGVPYIVRLKESMLSGHQGEMRFSYRGFGTESDGTNTVITKKPITVESVDVEGDNAPVNPKCTYKVTMLGNIDPEGKIATKNSDNAKEYIYSYMLTKNKFLQIPEGRTAQNKGFRGWLDITATPRTSGGSAPASNLVLSMFLDDNGVMTGILDAEADNDPFVDTDAVGGYAGYSIYSLSGIRLGNDISTLPAGVYIINNKKVVKR